MYVSVPKDISRFALDPPSVSHLRSLKSNICKELLSYKKIITNTWTVGRPFILECMQYCCHCLKNVEYSLGHNVTCCSVITIAINLKKPAVQGITKKLD